MAWWDHEELKDSKDRSDRYKLTFENEYTEEELVAAAKSYIRNSIADHHLRVVIKSFKILQRNGIYNDG